MGFIWIRTDDMLLAASNVRIAKVQRRNDKVGYRLVSDIANSDDQYILAAYDTIEAAQRQLDEIQQHMMLTGTFDIIAAKGPHATQSIIRAEVYDMRTTATTADE